jgi:thiol-disulfide isomerase/thioredoxin
MIKQLALLIGVFFSISTYGQYDIAVTIRGLSCDDELLLANHFGDKQYLKDTSECNKGVFHFKGKEKLKSGVYLVVLPEKNYFEILVSEKEDQMKYVFDTDTSLRPEVTVAKGSRENELFLEFNKFAVAQSLKASELKKKMDAEINEAEKKKLEGELRAIGTGVTTKRNEMAEANSSLYVGKLYKAMREVTVVDAPEELSEEEGRRYQFMWLREHYWDNVDMSEDGLVVSPVFHNKIKDYFDNYMPPLPDTAILMGDNLINKIEKGGSKEQYKYAIHFMLGYFEESKFMCFDKALWHIAKNYYCAGKAYWADSAYVAKMCEESAKMEPALCDLVASDLNMPDTSFKRRISMYSINKPVTVLVFWDINCGTCKKELPIISHIYDSMTNKNFEVYAVYTKGEWEGWKERVASEKYNFINVANAFGEDDFHKNYNIQSVPQIFILDKDKKIRFKKIGAENIPEIVQFLLEEQGIVESTSN